MATTRAQAREAAQEPSLTPASLMAPVTVFGGASAEAKIWLKIYQDVSEMSGWTEAQRLKGVLSYLKQEPAQWAAELCTATDWTKWVEEFEARYIPKTTQRDAIQGLYSIKLSAFHSFEEFRLKFQALLGDAKILDDESSIGFLSQVSPQATQDALMRLHPKTLAEAMSIVETEDRIYRLRRRVHDSHPRRGRGNPPFQRRGQRPIPYQRSGPRPNQYGRDNTCFKCGQPGHYKWECPNRATVDEVEQGAMERRTDFRECPGGPGQQ